MADTSADRTLLLARAIEAGAVPRGESPSLARESETRVLPSELSRLTTLWDINRLDLEAVSGGYDAVVQIAAEECLRRLNRSHQFVLQRGLSGAELDAALAAGRPFANAGLNDPTLSSRLGENAFINVTLSGYELSIGDGGALTLRLRGDAALGQLVRAVRVGPGDVVIPGPMVFLSVAALGDYDVSIEARWAARIEADNARVNINMETAGATLRGSRASGDFHPFYRTVIAAEESDLLLSGLRARRSIPLSPALSIVGRAPAHESARSLASRVDVGVVGERELQAFAIGWNFSAARPAMVGAIRHFAGPYAYAALHSTPSIQAVITNLWARPEFDKSFVVEVEEERVNPDGARERFATPVRVTLGSLRAAGCVEEPTARSGCLQFTGRGVLSANSVRRADGTVVPAEERRRDFDYDVAGQLTLEAVWSPSPVMFGIQRILHRAFESLTRPFERWTAGSPPAVAEFRVDGVRGRALFVGDLSD